MAFLHVVFFWSAAQTPGVFLVTPEALLKSMASGALFGIWSTLGIWFYPYMAFVTMNPGSRSQSSDRDGYALIVRWALFIFVHSVMFLLSPVLGVMVYRKSRKRRMAKKLMAQSTVRKGVVLRDIEEGDPDALEDVAEVNAVVGGRYIRRDPNRFNT
jgi:hypothetical protein